MPITDPYKVALASMLNNEAETMADDDYISGRELKRFLKVVAAAVETVCTEPEEDPIDYLSKMEADGEPM